MASSCRPWSARSTPRLNWPSVCSGAVCTTRSNACLAAVDVAQLEQCDAEALPQGGIVRVELEAAAEQIRGGAVVAGVECAAAPDVVRVRALEKLVEPPAAADPAARSPRPLEAAGASRRVPCRRAPARPARAGSARHSPTGRRPGPRSKRATASAYSPAGQGDAPPGPPAPPARPGGARAPGCTSAPPPSRSPPVKSTSASTTRAARSFGRSSTARRYDARGCFESAVRFVDPPQVVRPPDVVRQQASARCGGSPRPRRRRSPPPAAACRAGRRRRRERVRAGSPRLPDARGPPSGRSASVGQPGPAMVAKSGIVTGSSPWPSGGSNTDSTAGGDDPAELSAVLPVGVAAPGQDADQTERARQSGTRVEEVHRVASGRSRPCPSIRVV